MRIKTVVLALLAGLLLAMPAIAAEPCCEGKMCSHLAACCTNPGDKAAASVFLPRENATPVRQTAVVWFTRPVRVGDRILLGKYIIEHDNDRQARGLPCTHIYEANGRRLPVVGFHCTHLTRNVTDHATVTLRSSSDPTGMKTMTEFQFAGDSAAHGVPTNR